LYEFFVTHNLRTLLYEVKRTQVMEYIGILKCPITGEGLRKLNNSEIESLNAKINSSLVWQANGKLMTEKVQDGLICERSIYIYPIIDDIILLLKDLAIVEDKSHLITDVLSEDKMLVKNFYDDRGWNVNEGGDYEDADIFEDLRPVSKEYISKCHSRVNTHLPKSGKYMLDAASGALQYDAYLLYSENFEYRICVDMSFKGLRECKKKLGKKAICVLCDMTNMPFKDEAIDGFISLNTIYHIPESEQVKAIAELHRLLIKGGKGVIVYDWYKHSMWMNISLLPFRAIEFFRHRILNLLAKLSGQKKETKMLYFHAHNYEYFKENIPFSFELHSWRSISVPFMKVYIHSWLFGKKILECIYDYEEKNPEKCGALGEYPMFIIEKK